MTHFNPLGHISIGVRNYHVSKAFYTAVLSTIGLDLVYDSEAVSSPAASASSSSPTQQPSSSSSTANVPGTEPKKKKTRTLGYGPSPEHELLNIFEFGDEASPPGAGFHLAFNAPTRDAVVEFHAMAMGFGGTNHGLPGLRKHYGKNYYAAFVVDPDGWRLEAVCKNPSDTEGEDEGETRVDAEGSGESRGDQGQ